MCACVHKMNLRYALRWHIHILVHSVLCQCYTQAHAHPKTIWGPQTNRAKSGHCPGHPHPTPPNLPCNHRGDRSSWGARTSWPPPGKQNVPATSRWRKCNREQWREGAAPVASQNPRSSRSAGTSRSPPTRCTPWPSSPYRHMVVVVVVVTGSERPVNHTGSPPDGQTRVISKYTFLNSSHIYINPLSRQSTKPISSQT